MARSEPCISAIFASTSLSPAALSLFARASAFSSLARSFIAARSSAVNPLDVLRVVLFADFCVAFLALIETSSRCDLLQHRVDAREAGLRTLLDAVLHGGVTLVGRLEAHCLRQLRLLAEVLELEGLEMVLKGLDEPLGRVDFAELALDDAEGCLEPIGAAGPDVHLLDNGAVAPPFWDQVRIRPDRVDVRAWCVEDPLDADLELVRGGDGCGIHRAPFVRSTTCAKRSRRCSHVLMPSKAYGASVHLRARPTFSVATRFASSSSRT